jgi:hypothetical protein
LLFRFQARVLLLPKITQLLLSSPELLAETGKMRGDGSARRRVGTAEGGSQRILDVGIEGLCTAESFG